VPDRGIGHWRRRAVPMRQRGSHGIMRIFVIVAKHVLVFILVHVTANAETQAEAEGGICRGDSRVVGCCGRVLVDGL